MDPRSSENSVPDDEKPALPAPLSPIIGRDLQIEQAISLLVGQDVRLLTLTGPGGIGKTRLALEIAHQLAEWRLNGVMFIELDSVTEPELAPAAIARAVGAPEQTGDSEADLFRWLRNDDRLLVLDNFEQIRDAAPFLTTLLARCPELRIVVTSRVAPLHLEGERVLPVGPLPFPNEAIGTNFDPADYPAISYFLQHAPSVDIESSRSAVARICQRLDGIPLALELAAARVGLLTVGEIAEQATGWLSLLTVGRRDAPDRHRTMEAAIRWSYELLDEELQEAFRTLSVFAGGFSRDTASAVSGISSANLTLLIESKLVEAASNSPTEARFRLLEPVRDFGLQVATERDELENSRSSHAAWARKMAREVSPNLFGSRLYSEDGARLEEMLELERGNLTAALGWLIGSGDVAGALHIAGVLSDFWYRRMYPAEGLKWLGDALRQPRLLGEEASGAFVKACMGMTLLTQVVGNFEGAEHYGNLGLASARAIEDQRAIGESLAVLGYLALHRGQFERSTQLSERALEIFCKSEFEDRAWQSDLHENLAQAALQQRNIAEASMHVAQGVALAREVGDLWSISASLFTLGDVRCHQRRFVEALDAYEECFDGTVRRVERTASALWHQAVHGMASCSTLAHFALPEERGLVLPMIIRTEELCRQVGTAMPNNRVTYARIRDEYLGQGVLGDRSQAESQANASLDVALDETKATMALLRRMIEGKPGAIAVSDQRGPNDDFPGSASSWHSSPEAITPLTPKQLETVRRIVAGKTVKEIAAIEEVGESTVYERLDRIRERWGLQAHATMAEIAVFAIRNGIV